MMMDQSLFRRMPFVGMLLIIANIALAQTPSPALLVLNKEENSLAIVDPVAAKVVGRAPTGEATSKTTRAPDMGNRG
jgi:hypothetical protein